MKQLLRAVQLLIIAHTMYGNTLLGPGRTTCMPGGSFASYIGSQPCQTYDVVFSNFSETSTSNPPGFAISPSQTPVIPLATIGFYYPINATDSTLSDGTEITTVITIGFEAQALKGAITGVSLDLNGNGTHYGTVTLVASYCPGHPVQGCPGGGGQIEASSNGPYFPSQSIDPTTDLWLMYTATLQTGPIASTVNMPQFETNIDFDPDAVIGIASVPEPPTLSSWSLFFLSGLFLWRRRVRRS